MNTIRTLQRLFSARRFTDDHRPVSTAWLSTESTAALIEPSSGRVRALIEHDGYGKYFPVLYVSPWRALQLVRNNRGYVVSALGFPRLAVELVRYKADSMAQAQHEIAEDYFGDGS